MRSFAKIKPFRNDENSLSFIDVCISCQIFYLANMSFNAIRENKILSKISKFTVTLCLLGNFSYFLLSFAVFFQNQLFQGYHQGVKQFGSSSGLTFCQA